MDNNIIAMKPIARPQKSNNVWALHYLMFALRTYVIESPVVATKMVVRIKSKEMLIQMADFEIAKVQQEG